MESIIQKICEVEALGIHYIFIGIESKVDLEKKPSVWLQCSKRGYNFIEDFSLLQIFLNFIQKESNPANECINHDLSNQFINNSESNEVKDNTLDTHNNHSIKSRNSELANNSIDLNIIKVESQPPPLIENNIILTTHLDTTPSTNRRSIRTTRSKNYEIVSKTERVKKNTSKKLSSSLPNKTDQFGTFDIYESTMEESIAELPSSKLILKGTKAVLINCAKCNKTFDDKEAHSLHSWIHTKSDLDTLLPNIMHFDEIEIYKCNDCGKVFSTRELANIHSWRHRNGEIDNKIRLGVHIPENEKPFLCDDCGKRFVTLVSARGHFKRIHQINMKSYSCRKCGRVLKSASSLRLHLKHVHSAESAYSCSKCGKVFKWKAGLSRHMEEHLLQEKGVEPNHTCNHCGKVFQTIARLRIHKYNIRVNKQRKENSAKRYLCFVCGSGFFLNCDLQRHIHMHHPHENLDGRFPQGYITKHVCSVCNKICADKSKLRSHMRCHTGEKPFQCQYCGKAFAHKHYLKKHNRNLFCINQRKP